MRIDNDLSFRFAPSVVAMNAEQLVRSTTAACLVGEAFVVASLLGACAVPSSGAWSDDAANYGLSVAAELRVADTPAQVAACLRQRENRASYPQGVGPGFTATEYDDGAVRLTQWFSLKRGMTWATRFVLRPVGDAATDVQILLPTELTIAQAYRRAAIELVAHCQAILSRVQVGQNGIADPVSQISLD